MEQEAFALFVIGYSLFGKVDSVSRIDDFYDFYVFCNFYEFPDSLITKSAIRNPKSAIPSLCPS
jgi:hypothetical protein